MTKELAKLESKAEQLDKVAQQYAVAIAKDSSPFTSALVLSQGITALRELLSDDIMGEIMKLADTPLGFMTDKATKGGYKSSEVKDAIIEAALRGFRVAGNEFNIISSRFYGAKNGMHRKVITFPGLTDFTESFGVPKFSNSGQGAVVTAKATWMLALDDSNDLAAPEPIKMELTREFAIRVNSGMGADAITGKAQRKLYAAVLNRLTGTVTPEGEIDDSILTTAEVVKEPEAKAQRGPDPTPGVWEGKLTMVERKSYMDEDKEGKVTEKWYFVLTIDNGWRGATFSESILEQAEISIGLDVRMSVKQGRSRSIFNIESFEVLKPEPKKEQATDDLPFE